MSAAKFILLSALLLPAIVANAQAGGDVQAQILYAFETEDSNSLVNLIQGLTTQVKSDAGDIAAHYHLAHAQYRNGQLLRERKAHQAETAFSACIDQLKPVLDKNGKSVEALAL